MSKIKGFSSFLLVSVTLFFLWEKCAVVSIPAARSSLEGSLEGIKVFKFIFFYLYFSIFIMISKTIAFFIKNNSSITHFSYVYYIGVPAIVACQIILYIESFIYTNTVVIITISLILLNTSFYFLRGFVTILIVILLFLTVFAVSSVLNAKAGLLEKNNLFNPAIRLVLNSRISKIKIKNNFAYVYALDNKILNLEELIKNNHLFSPNQKKSG